jgi:hypothetical protein
MATATAEVFKNNDALELVSSFPEIYLHGKFNNQARTEALWRTLIGHTMINAPESEHKGHLGFLGRTIDLSLINNQRPAENDYWRFFEMERRLTELFSLVGVTRDMPWNDVLEHMKAFGQGPGAGKQAHLLSSKRLEVFWMIIGMMIHLAVVPGEENLQSSTRGICLLCLHWQKQATTLALFMMLRHRSYFVEI